MKAALQDEFLELRNERLRAEIARLHAAAENEAAEAEEYRTSAELNRQHIASSKIAQRGEEVGVRVLEETERKRLAKDEYSRIYSFTESVSQASVNKCIQTLAEWSRIDPKCDIEIIFNSPGGDVISGMALYDYILGLRRQGHKITTTGLGMAASMAGILLQAGDKRVMGSEAWLLIHEGSFGAGGTAGEVEDTVEWVKKIQQRILRIFAGRSNLTVAQLDRRWKRKNWWLDADEALKLGLVDEIR